MAINLSKTVSTKKKVIEKSVLITSPYKQDILNIIRLKKISDNEDLKKFEILL